LAAEREGAAHTGRPGIRRSSGLGGGTRRDPQQLAASVLQPTPTRHPPPSYLTAPGKGSQLLPHSVCEQLSRGKLEHTGTRAQARSQIQGSRPVTCTPLWAVGTEKNTVRVNESWREASQLCCHKASARRDWKRSGKEGPSSLAAG